MAGIATRGVTIATAEPLSTLGAKLSQLATLSTFSGFSDAEAGSLISLLRTQATAPSAVANDFWYDTTAFSLRPYDTSGDSFSISRWALLGHGDALKNSTGGTRAVGDVVSRAGTPTAFAYDNDATGSTLGVVCESTADTVFGGVRMSGLATVKVDGTVVRGDYLGKSGSAGYSATDIGGLANSFGIALTTPGGGTCTAYLWGYNE